MQSAGKKQNSKQLKPTWFSAVLIIRIIGTMFRFVAVNMSMVMGLAPVKGVPLPLVSYRGSAMLVLMATFGFIQSAHIHGPRSR